MAEIDVRALRSRLSIFLLVFCICGAASSAAVFAMASEGATIPDSPSGVFAMASAVIGGVFGVGAFYGLLTGRLSLIEYRLTQIEEGQGSDRTDRKQHQQQQQQQHNRDNRDR